MGVIAIIIIGLWFYALVHSPRSKNSDQETGCGCAIAIVIGIVVVVIILVALFSAIGFVPLF